MSFLFIVLLLGCGAPQPDQETTRSVDLQSEVVSILNNRCASCHGADGTNQGGFNFVDNIDLMITREYIIIDNADGSPIYQRMVATDNTIMPPTGAITANEISKIKTYIDTLDGE